MVKPFLRSDEALRRDKQLVAAQQFPLHLISSITLLFFPSNPVKHKKMGD